MKTQTIQVTADSFNCKAFTLAIVTVFKAIRTDIGTYSFLEEEEEYLPFMENKDFCQQRMW